MKTEKNTENKTNKRIEKSEVIKINKARWPKKVKNALTNFKVLYQNVRGS